MISIARASLAGFALLFTALAQDGHYTGTIQAPDREVKFTIDIEKATTGWTGYMSMTGGPRELPLDKITFTGDSVSFALKAPNPPTFTGKWDKDAGTIKGNVSGPNGDVPFEMTRAGEAKKIVATPSTPITPDFIGKWEGALEVGGKSLRLELQLRQGADGKAQGNIVSLDQGNAEIEISTITQTDNKLAYEIRMIGGDFKGTLNEAKTEIAGDWTQGGRTLPLTFKKSVSVEKK